jgi:hypothetical protein
MLNCNICRGNFFLSEVLQFFALMNLELFGIKKFKSPPQFFGACG